MEGQASDCYITLVDCHFGSDDRATGTTELKGVNGQSNKRRNVVWCEKTRLSPLSVLVFSAYKTQPNIKLLSLRLSTQIALNLHRFISLHSTDIVTNWTPHYFLL